MSHLGRPTKGEFEAQYSLAPGADHLSNLLGKNVRLVSDYCSQPVEMDKDEVVLLENVRFNKGETVNDPKLSQKYGRLCDIFVMDAFGIAFDLI